MTTRIVFLAFLLAASLGASAQVTAAKTFTKSFNTENKGTIRLDLPGEVDLKIWNNPSIRIEVSVSLPSGNSAMLNELATVGRYNIMAKPVEDVLVIQTPNMQKQIRVKGEELREVLSFVVFMPKDLKVQLLNGGQLAEAKK